MQNVFYGKKSVLIANILSTSNQVVATKASAPVVATRSHLARKHLAIIAVIAITGFTIACPSGSKSSAQAYTCPNGDPKIGTTTNESTVNCIACATGFSLEANACIASPWTLRDSGATNSLRDVIYGGPSGGELFVAVGDCLADSDSNCSGDGAIITSPDGITWTVRDSGVTDGFFYGVTYGGASGSELFVAVGAPVGASRITSSAAIITSPDGITWTLRDSGVRQQLYHVTYGRGLFVAVGVCPTDSNDNCSDNGAIITSPDGITWTARDSGIRTFINSVTYGGASGSELFVAVGSCPTNSNRNCSGDGVILTSSDGSNWTPRDSGLQSNFFGIANRTEGLITIFAAVGGCTGFLNVNAMCSHSNPILTSNNGIGWGTKENPNGRLLTRVTATADGFLAVGICPLDTKNERCIGNASIVTSSDSVAWTAEESGVQTVLWAAAYGNGISVIVGGGADCANVVQNSDCTGNSVILTK